MAVAACSAGRRGGCLLGLPRAWRSITVRASQRKLREASYEGPNGKLAEDAPDKAQTRQTSSSRSSRHIRASGEMKQLTRGGDFHGALDVFAGVDQPDGVLYDAALHACAKAHWHDRATGIWDQMPSDTQSVVSYSVMIDLCGRLKRLSEAEQFLERMQGARLQPTIVTLTSMARAYGMADEPQGALKVLEEGSAALAAASHRGRQMFYQVVMSAFARLGDYAKTRELFMQMTSSCTHPDHGHYNALLASCARHNLAPTAQAVFEYMRGQGLEPRLEDYNILLGCHRQSLPRCLELYAEMQAKGFRPTGTTQQQILEAYVLARDGRGAVSFAAEAEELDCQSAKVERLLREARELSLAAP